MILYMIVYIPIQIIVGVVIINLLGFLQVTLIILKALDFIKYSWWLILVPTYLYIIIYIVLLVIAIITTKD